MVHRSSGTEDKWDGWGMTEGYWTEISIRDRKVVSADGGRIEIHWTLTETPESAWQLAFNHDNSGKSGSIAYVMGPDATVAGDVIRWVIPEESLENANTVVNNKVAHANQRFRAVTEERVAEADRKSKAENATAEKIAEAQARLDKLS